MYVTMFPEQLLALREEIQYHPDLRVILAAQTNPDIYVHLADIALYCGMALDGTYSYQDVLELCEIMTATLQKRRIIIIN